MLHPCFILDIFRLEYGPAVAKDPFTNLNTTYIKDIKGQPECFLQNTAPNPNETNPDTRVDHNLTITLLPHQIIIFPAAIQPFMNADDVRDKRIYTNAELRYHPWIIKYKESILCQIYALLQSNH